MNIIDAIFHLVKHPVIELVEYYRGKNRANTAGDALEEYIKDLFADSFDLNEAQRLQRQSEVFSYLGNDRTPPDAMLRGGDAIEVKKIETDTAALALNSSYPKHILSKDNLMLSSACKDAECWSEKDMIYAVGIVKNGNRLRQLAMVYGLDYCASEECYSRIRTTIKDGVEAIPGIEFAESKELGHINKVDPLGITYMRIRGMWGIKNPWNVFDYIYRRNPKKSFNFMCIINDAKWDTFDNTTLLTDMQKDGFKIEHVKIKNPDNPAKLVDARLITCCI